MSERTEADKKYHEKNREKRKEQMRARYYQKKREQAKKATTNNYTAKDIKVLIPLEKYLGLSKEKQRIWSDFQWVFKDIQRYGVYTIGEIQELVAKGENLIKDYLETAKAEVTSRAKGWNSLSKKERTEFIAYLARKKVRENKRVETEEKEMEELAKELVAELGKELEKAEWNCASCEREWVRKKEDELLEEVAKEEKEEKVQCANCERWVKELDEDDACKKCAEEFGES